MPPQTELRERTRLEPLTGLRGVAALSVLLAHALDTSWNYSGHAWWQPFSSRLAYFGMSLFFVLSGFVITYNYAPLFAKKPLREAIRIFFVARFARLYPLYAISLLAMGQVSYFSLPVATSYLTLTQSWFNVEMATFAPDWSLSTEWFFYCAFIPIVMLFPQTQRPLRAIAISSAAVAVVLIIIFNPLSSATAAVARMLFWHNSNISADAFGWAKFFAPYTRLPEFLLGIFAARAFVLGHKVRTEVGWLAVAWCTAVLFISPLTTATLLHGIMPNFVFASAIMLAALSSCQADWWLARALSSRPMLFAGEISYSIYIWSWAAMRIVGGQYSSQAPSSGAFVRSTIGVALIVLLTIIFAYGSYMFIEMPARRWLRQVLHA